MPPAASRAKSTNTGRSAGFQKLSRERILAVAAQLFRDKGYRATNLQEVADVFGVRRPAIYYYFASKAEILVEIHNRLLHALVARLDEITATDLPAAEKLARVIRSQVEIYAQNIAELAVFIENESELPRRVYLAARAEKRRYHDLLVDLYRQGVAEGQFIDADPTLVIQTLTGLTGWMYRWYRPDGRCSPTEIADAFLGITQHGYLVEQPSGQLEA